MIEGRVIEPLPSIEAIQKHAKSAVAALPSALLSIDEQTPYPVHISSNLFQLAEELRQKVHT
jgi:hypothetical protein